MITLSNNWITFNGHFIGGIHVLGKYFKMIFFPSSSITPSLTALLCYIILPISPRSPYTHMLGHLKLSYSSLALHSLCLYIVIQFVLFYSLHNFY